MVKRSIQKHVEKNKARHKWLAGDRYHPQDAEWQDPTEALEGQGEASEDGERCEALKMANIEDGGYLCSEFEQGQHCGYFGPKLLVRYGHTAIFNSTFPEV